MGFIKDKRLGKDRERLILSTCIIIGNISFLETKERDAENKIFRDGKGQETDNGIFLYGK